METVSYRGRGKVLGKKESLRRRALIIEEEHHLKA